MEPKEFEVLLTLQRGYQFSVDFGADAPPGLEVDEPPPLGGGEGPNPARLLGVAVGHCLGASLLFCLRKYRIEVGEMRVRVHVTLVRNEQGRLRIGSLKVKLDPLLSREDWARAARCLESFEDYCIVTESVRKGIDVEVEVNQPSPAA